MAVNLRRNGMMPRSNGNNQLPPRQNVVIQVKRYELDNPKKGSNPEKDVLVGYLMQDVPEWGLTAKFEEVDGVETPMTEVRVNMPLPRGVENSRRRDVFGLSRPKGQGAAMGEGSWVILEKAWFDRKDNTIKAHYSHGCATREQVANMTRQVYPGVMACVRAEAWIPSGERAGWSGRVDVLLAEISSAMVIKSKEEMHEHVSELIAANAVGNPGFILLAKQNCPDGQDPDAFAADPNTRYGTSFIIRPKPVKNEANDEVTWVPRTAEEAMSDFFRIHENELSMVFGKDDWQVELVPMVAVNQAKTRVPSNREDNPDGRDNSLVYGIFEETSEADRDRKNSRHVVQRPDGKLLGMVDNGWILSNVACERFDVDSNVWYSTYQAPVAQRSDIYLIHDLDTPNTKPYHSKAIAETCKAIQENRGNYWRAAKNSQNEDNDNDYTAAPPR